MERSGDGGEVGFEGLRRLEEVLVSEMRLVGGLLKEEEDEGLKGVEEEEEGREVLVQSERGFLLRLLESDSIVEIEGLLL